MRVLVLLSDRPAPPITGPRVRNFFLWPAMSRLGVEVRVLGTDLDPSTDRQAAFPGLEAEFFRCERPGLPARALRALARSYHEVPRSPALARRVDELAGSWRPNIIHAEELRMAYYLPGVRGCSTQARQSLTLHNVETDLFPRIAHPAVPWARGLAKRLHVHSLRTYEARAVARTNLRFAYSVHDQKRYAELYPDKRWLVTRNGTNAMGITPAPQPVEPKLLLLATWSYAPNRSGIEWFLNAIAPRLAPQVQITVAGSGADASLQQLLAERRMRFVDTPIDLKPLYDEHAIVIVPLLEGSGTRGKILEALAHERLVITTPKGAEGLEIREGEGIVIADGAEPLAARINEEVRLFEDRAAQAHRGRQVVLARYDWSVVASELKQAWDSCASP